MAVSAFQKVLNRLFRQFALRNGREPQTPKEWMDIQNEAVNIFNKTKGVPPGPKKPPFQGFTPKVIEGGKSKKGIESLLETGDVKVGVAPKTTKETLKAKKDRGILLRDADEDIARIKRENKQAIKDFKEKTKKRDRPSIRLIKNFERDLTDIELAQEGYNLQEIGIIKRARDVMKKENQNPDDALQWVRSEMADDAGIEFEEFMPDFDWGDFSGKAEGGLAYMLGEPTYMKAGGGHVGHGPWTTGQAAPQPQQQLETPPPQVQGQPNPLKAPRGIPSAAPRSMDPQVMQQQMMQRAMMGQRPRMQEGGMPEIPEEFLEDFKRREYYKFLDQYRRFQEDYERRKDLAPTQEAAGGGRIPLKHGTNLKVWGKTVDEQWPNLNEDQKQYIRENFPDAIHEKSQGGRIGLMYGGDPGFAFEYGGSWADWHDQHRNAMPIEDYIKTKLPKERLPFRAPFAGGGMSRRMFMKLMAGLASLPFIGKGVQKAAPKVIPKVTETIARDADGIPTYAFDLIEVVKAKGTKEIMEGIYKRNPPSTKYKYKDVEVVEDGLGNTSVRKEQTQTGSWTDEANDDVLVDDYVDREIGFEIRKGEDIVKDEGLETQKAIRGADEYNESTAYMQGDPEGGMDVAEIAEQIDIEDHLDLKKIADEIIDIRPKKASGGLAHMLGE